MNLSSVADVECPSCRFSWKCHKNLHFPLNKKKGDVKMICLTELKKRIKEEKETLNRYLRNDVSNRDERIFVNNDNSFSNDYDYERTTDLIQLSMLKIVKMTSLLNKYTSNTMIKCDEFEGSISEAVTLLKYLNELNNRADQMLIQDVSQKLTYDNKLVVMQYYYETEEVEEKKKVITKKIQKLQMAIDKVMLNTEIDIDNILNLNFTDLEKVFG